MEVARYLFVVLFLTYCAEPTPLAQSEPSPTDSALIQTQQPVDFYQIMEFTRSEALDRYGAPVEQHRGTLANMVGIYYNGLQAAFTEEERRRSDSIVIDELIWAVDTARLVTVWYEVRGGEGYPKDDLHYAKWTDF